MNDLVIGQFNDSFPPIMDGVGNVVKNYSYWLNKKYGKCYTVTPSFPDYKDNEDFEVLRYFSVKAPMRPPYRLGIYKLDFGFMNKMRRIPFNLIHAHCPFSSGRLALKISRERNIPIVATFHSKYYDDFKEAVKIERVARQLTNYVVDFYNSVDYVWTVNQASADTLRSYGFNGNIEIMYNGTDFNVQCDKAKAVKYINEKLKLKNEEILFLFVGQHIWQKNIKLIVESLSILKNKDIEFKMVFVGEGPAQNDLKEMVEELNLGDRVKFLGAIMDREFLKKLYSRGNLFLFPSLYDTSGIVVKEAAFCGCPSLLIEGSNAAEGIIDNYNGYLSHNDSEAYAKKIFKIVSDKDKLLNTGKNARKTLCEEWETIVDKVNERYSEIVDNRHV